jgi:hypothetical protein
MSNSTPLRVIFNNRLFILLYTQILPKYRIVSNEYITVKINMLVTIRMTQMVMQCYCHTVAVYWTYIFFWYKHNMTKSIPITYYSYII